MDLVSWLSPELGWDRDRSLKDGVAISDLLHLWLVTVMLIYFPTRKPLSPGDVVALHFSLGGSGCVTPPNHSRHPGSPRALLKAITIVQ